MISCDPGSMCMQWTDVWIQESFGNGLARYFVDRKVRSYLLSYVFAMIPVLMQLMLLPGG